VRITDAIAVGNQWVVEYQRRAEMLAKHLDLHIRAMDALEESWKPEEQKKEMMLTADALLIHVVKDLCRESAPCQCGEVDADTTPLEPRGPVDITMPAPGPWRASPHPLELDDRPVCSTVLDQQGEIVKGLLICAGIDQPSVALANVNLVLMAPRLLASLMRVTRLLHVLHDADQWTHGPSDTLHDPALLENLDEVLEAATPIRKPKTAGEGGAP
jgi:hypothetical protein